MDRGDLWWFIIIILFVIVPSILYFKFVYDKGFDTRDGSTLDAVLKKDGGLFSSDNPKLQEDLSESDLDLNNSSILKISKFERGFKPVKGYIVLFESNGNKNLMFYNFSIKSDSVDNLHVYLSSSSIADDFVDLGILKEINGTFVYSIKEMDLEKYKNVLIWYRPFGILYAKAEL
ncbi:DM13 domain-containing protein [Candidatus Woesearchaeota archaeon]|nr:DM13 domain-containing protein [Candidatus Woesearchaeota archaeon]